MRRDFTDICDETTAKILILIALNKVLNVIFKQDFVNEIGNSAIIYSNFTISNLAYPMQRIFLFCINLLAYIVGASTVVQGIVSMRFYW